MNVVVMGVAGSGKSRIGANLARSLRWTFYDADHFHPPANIDKMRGGTPLDDSDREMWLERLEALLTGSEGRGESVVLACSALRQEHRARLEAAAAEVVFGDTDYASLIGIRCPGRPSAHASRLPAGSERVAVHDCVRRRLTQSPVGNGFIGQVTAHEPPE